MTRTWGWSCRAGKKKVRGHEQGRKRERERRGNTQGWNMLGLKLNNGGDRRRGGAWLLLGPNCSSLSCSCRRKGGSSHRFRSSSLYIPLTIGLPLASPSPSLISYHLHLHHHLYQLTQSAKLSIPPPAALSYKSVNRCNGICLDFKEIINQLVLFILFLQMLSAFLAGISLCSFTALMYCRLMQRSSELFYLLHYHLTLFFSSLSLRG